MIEQAHLMKVPPLRLLPDGARHRFSKLEQAADQFRHQEAYAQGRAAEIRKVLGMNVSIDASERRQLEIELRDYQETLKNASDNHRAARVVFNAVHKWVEGIAAGPPTRGLEEAPAIKPPRQKNEGLKACLDRLRDEIAAIKSQQHKISLAPLPASDLKQRAAAYVEQMAKAGKPLPMVEKDGRFTVQWFGGPGSAISPYAVFAMLCAFDPECAKECLADAIDALPEPTVEPMSAFDKEQKLKQLGVQLDQLERAEEATILALHSEGSVNITRRHDASPMALLGIQFVKPSALKQVPRRPTNGNGEHKPEKRKRAKRRDAGIARIRPKTSRADRAARH
ncbi:MAG: hypothetical protein IT536_15375 [Hyphomicrobiales bacterium]|nr:hypothetical protein [Hyphomicrobiales bacterium]